MPPNDRLAEQQELAARRLVWNMLVENCARLAFVLRRGPEWFPLAVSIADDVAKLSWAYGPALTQHDVMLTAPG